MGTRIGWMDSSVLLEREIEGYLEFHRVYLYASYRRDIDRSVLLHPLNQNPFTSQNRSFCIRHCISLGVQV